MKKIILAVFAVCFAFVAQATAAEFSADQVASVAGMKTSSKIYFKNLEKMRTETMGMVVIINGPVSYQLFPEKKQYVITDMEEIKEQNVFADVDDFEEFIEKNDMKKTGTETVSGYKCDVYEGTLVVNEDTPRMAMKFWYSEKLDYPVKTEAQLPSPMSGKTVSVLENIETGRQPDSLFEIPSGYTEAASMAEAMGMGGFAMPSGEGSGEMPSQEDMEQMMKMMQEMMGGAQE